MIRPAALSIQFIERLPLIPDRPAIRYGVSIALCLFALWLRWELAGAFPPGYPFLTFFPAVILSSFLFGPRPGLMAALICGLFAWYFFIGPANSFAVDGQTLVALAFYAGVVAVDIALVHLMQRANARLRTAREDLRRMAEERGKLAERAEILFQELQHRVGNNLQMIGAVLSLQMRGLEEPVARRAISDAADRLQVIGRIQRRLYRTDGELLPLDSFVSELTGHIMETSGRDGISMMIVAEPGLILKPDASVPVALILNEAIANALEHGFGTRTKGAIRVGVSRKGEAISLSVEDDGAGLPIGFTLDGTDSIGLRISRVLSRQLGAEYALESIDPGARMTLLLPPSRLAEPA